MKAETYLTKVIRKEFKKTAIESKRLARRIIDAQLVRAIKEGPERTALGQRAYAN